MKSDMTYLENGIKITVLPTYAPRKAEKTFPATRYSVSNMGRKQVTMKVMSGKMQAYLIN